MKKLLTLALALALALSLSATAFAEGDDEDTGTTNRDTTITQNTDPKTGSTQVNYNVAPAYSVTIPSSVTIDGENGSNTVTVSAKSVKVEKNKQVVVKLTGINVTTENNSDTDFKVKTAEGAELKYTVTDASNNTITLTDNTVLTVAPGQNNETDENGSNLNTGASTGSATLTFALATNEVVEYAGEYKGTVTFTVSVDAVSTGSNDTGSNDTGSTTTP